MKDFSKDNIHVGIIGAGVMGRGIAQICAASGLDVTIMDIELNVCEEAKDFAIKMLWRSVEKGKMNEEDFQSASKRLKVTNDFKQLAETDLVIEAIVEKLEIKQSLFGDLEKIVGPDCILATNTSSLSVTSIASISDSPERIAGFHFFNPVPLMKLVEVVKGIRTSEQTVNQLQSLAVRLGHSPVIVADSPGFLVNHCGRGLVTEGLRILSENISNPETVDTVMRECGGFRMGPFELMDLTGLDVTYPATEQIYQQYFQESRLRPTPLQQRRFQAGLYGRKVGEGFYKYNENEKQTSPQADIPEVKITSAFWISYKCDTVWREKICDLIKASGCEFDGADKPGENSIAIVIPLGCDVSTAAVNEGLVAEKTVGIETLFNMDKRIVLMGNPATSKDVINQVATMIKKNNKMVTIINDSPGFITQRIIATIINIACDIAQQGIAGPDDIDKAARLALGYPQGPLESGDKLGTENIIQILESMQRIYGDMRYRPSPWLRRRAQLGLSLLHEEPQFVSGGTK
ncbi:MAG: 3-hydroxyacyl-CoA dehydrogenase [Gammaproteobacteria bacterium]|nr:3-hydroxyacyl-CoA dehydrogenase [Gammaproteobacteria bacterium]